MIQCGFKLNEVADLQGGELIFPPGTKSLLSKYCTKEVWARNKLKRDKVGFSFKQAVLSGCRNTDSSIGVYAGSHDSYHAFKEIFDPIIEAYHGHKPEAQHKSDMDSSKLNCPPLVHDSNQGMIISTRIRVGRNLADFPLGPGLTRE